MSIKFRLTRNQKDILQYFVGTRGEEVHGYELHKTLGIGFGTLYPSLQRFVERGWMSSRQETEEEKTGKRPKTFYKLTGIGSKEAKEILKAEKDRYRKLGWLTWQR